MARPANEQGDRDDPGASTGAACITCWCPASARVKPNGEVYRNTDEDWLWLSEAAGKAARWLGYIPFERITDNRNAEPIIHRKARVTPEAFVSIGLDVTIPDADDIEPMAIAAGFEPRQAYHFAIFGEKASLEDVARPDRATACRPTSICRPARSATR